MPLRRTELFAYAQGKLITANHDNEGLLTHTPKSSAQSQTNFPAAHPLAEELLARLGAGAHNLLELGPGSGRNLPALLQSGARVWAIDQCAQRIEQLRARFSGEERLELRTAPYSTLPEDLPRLDGVLSTHALLHGTALEIRSALKQTIFVTRTGAILCATFGSVRDARFGKGERLGDATFASVDGDEAGIAHTYFDERDLRAALQSWEMLQLREVRVDGIAGKWAHQTTPLQGAVHWFAVVRRI